MRVSCRVSWFAFRESVACLQLRADSHSPYKHSPRKSRLRPSDWKSFLCRNYTVLWSWPKDHDWVLASPHAKLCNTLKHTSVSNPGTAALNPTSAATKWFTVFNLQNPLKSLHGIRHWPRTCFFGHV